MTAHSLWEGIILENSRKVWLDHYPEEIPHSLTYPEVPLTHFLEEAAKEYPDRDAVQFMGKRITYSQLLEESYRFGNALRQLGVQKGERISIMLPNCPQAMIAYYGSLFAGAIVVQTNPMYVERELLHQLTDSGAETIVCLDLLYSRVTKVLPETKIKRVIVTSIKDYLPFPKNILYPLTLIKDGIKPKVSYDNERIFRFPELLQKALSDPLKVDAAPNDIALLQYTGGTTGKAKGAILTHRNLVVNALQCSTWMYRGKKGQEKVLGVLPFFHVYGMTVVMNYGVYLAATLILVPRFEPENILKLIEKEKPTLFPGAPTMYIGLVNHPDIEKYDLSSIEACLSGSSALPVDVQEKFEKLTGGRLVEGYGLTEASPVTHANPIWGKRKTGSIGLPWPDTDCRIVDPETGKVCSFGEVGELQVRGPQVMQGYWNLPEETEKALKDGWLLTGDMASMDEEGYVSIMDRKKDMIIASGFNIYPREVEEVLFEHPAIQEAAVIGVPDTYRGETVKAFIVLKSGKTVTEEELEAYCREKLAAYKVPRLFEFRDELPKTMVGKVLRRVLLEEEQKKMEKSQ